MSERIEVDGAKPADSERVGDDVVAALAGMVSIEDSVTQGQERERRNEWLPKARAALAAQGQEVGFITDEGIGGAFARFTEAGHKLPAGTKLYTAPPASPAPASPDDAAALLDALQHNSWDLRCFDHTDGEDIGWRVIEHYQAEPRERVIAEVFEDNPRYAIKQALLAAAPSAPESNT